MEAQTRKKTLRLSLSLSTHSQCACVWLRASISLFRTLWAAARYVAFADRGWPGTAPTSDSRARESSPLSDAASVGSSAGGGTTGDAPPLPTAAAGLAGVITATGARRRTLEVLSGLENDRGAMVGMEAGSRWKKKGKKKKVMVICAFFRSLDGRERP